MRAHSFLRNVFEYVEQMIPHHLYGGDMKSFVGRMYVSQGGAEADHVEVGVALREESELETGMDAANDGLLAEESDV